MADEFIIGGVNVAPGTKQVIRLRVTQDLDGGQVAVWVHVLRGAKPGPTLGLFGVQHGNEWIDIEIMRPLVAQLNPQEMAGNLLVVPVCNPIALGNVQRSAQPESDGPDLNRVWPGTHTWLNESIAKVLAHEVVQRCSAVIDFHLGPWGSAFGMVRYAIDLPDPKVMERTRQMAIAFGHTCVGKTRVIEVFPGPRSLTGYAGGVLGIPAIGAEVGGTGFSTELERQWLDTDIRGVKNVMRHLGILNEPLEKPKRILSFSKSIRVNPTVGGLLIPEREPDELLREVKKGELLGQVISPYTFETLERLESPCDGYLFYMARSAPLRPGDWGFGVLDKKETEWISPD